MKAAAAGALAALGVSAAALGLEGAFLAPSGMKVTFSAEKLNVVLTDGTTIDLPAVTDGEAAEGRVTYSNGETDVVVEGDTVTVTNATTDDFCGGVAGAYTVAESDEGLTFTPVSDDCEPRKADMTAGVWTRAE